jgi:hypothetical protein
MDLQDRFKVSESGKSKQNLSSYFQKSTRLTFYSARSCDWSIQVLYVAYYKKAIHRSTFWGHSIQALTIDSISKSVGSNFRNIFFDMESSMVLDSDVASNGIDQKAFTNDQSLKVNRIFVSNDINERLDSATLLLATSVSSFSLLCMIRKAKFLKIQLSS